jgi:ABC-type anion transport system duplicated permease subunit
MASIAYVVIGVIVASQHSYYAHLATLSQVLSAVVATALWPLVLLGASLHLNLGHL